MQRDTTFRLQPARARWIVRSTLPAPRIINLDRQQSKQYRIPSQSSPVATELVSGVHYTS